jgi:N12 class adenine-specific DNA methylase
MSALKDILRRKPTIVLGPEIFDSAGKVVPSGHYQVSVNESYLELSQGATVVGKLRAQPAKDEWEESNAIIYARVLDVNDGIIKIIYSNLDKTFEGFARINRHYPRFF